MHPLIWRFTGGFSCSLAIEHLIPGYWEHVAHGANIALWGGGTRSGKAYEYGGRGVVAGGKMVLKSKGAHAMLAYVGAVGKRLSGPVGWALLAWDVIDIIGDVSSGDPHRVDENLWISTSRFIWGGPADEKNMLHPMYSFMVDARVDPKSASGRIDTFKQYLGLIV